MTAQLRQLSHDLAPQSNMSRVLYRAGVAWLAIGVMHVVVLAVTGWQWEGAISFRKPIVFSASIGLLLATVGWILDQLPARTRLRNGIGWTLLVASTIEVALITIQAWRGRASHFNVMESGDALIFIGMGIAVGFMSIALITILIWSLIEQPGDPLIRVATIGGLAMVALGLGIGQWIIELGNQFVADNGFVPDTVVNGSAGVVKFPHAIAFHGIQVFTVTALLLNRSAAPGRSRMRSMWLVVASYGGVLAAAMVQAIVGQSPSEFTLVGAIQFGAGVTLVATLGWITTHWWAAESSIDTLPVEVGQPI